jgi:hypothetical protein
LELRTLKVHWDGATTLSIMTLSITTLSIIENVTAGIATLRITVLGL